MRAMSRRIVFKKEFQAVAQAFFRRHSGNARFRIGFIAASLHSPYTEKKKRLAWSRGYPVGVSTPGVKECVGSGLRPFFRHLNQRILDFERTHLFECFLIFSDLIFCFHNTS